MPYVILSVFLAALVYLPSLRIKMIMRKHGKNRADLPGTGGELAEHLIKRFELEDVSVEATENRNDHYDPTTRTVRLGESNFNGKSLTAVAVAAHEVGHAIQFSRGEAISKLRNRYLPLAFKFKKLGVLLLTMTPLIAVIVRAPAAIFLFVAIGLLLQLLGALAYLIILPEEWDASFKKAMPILVEGEYITEDDIPAVQSVLKAAAYTYFAAALADLLNIGRWIMILRR
jgi:Zn-dependent membrane protease YugP